MATKKKAGKPPKAAQKLMQEKTKPATIQRSRARSAGQAGVTQMLALPLPELWP